MPQLRSQALEVSKKTTKRFEVRTQMIIVVGLCGGWSRLRFRLYLEEGIDFYTATCILSKASSHTFILIGSNAYFMFKQLITLILIVFICSNVLGQKNKTTINDKLNKLYDKNADIAINAFIELTEYNPVVISKAIDTISNSYSRDRHLNYSLPTFSFRFLKQLTLYTEYCRQNNITYKADKRLHLQLLELRNYKKHSNFPKKYKLENEILKRITLENISELEYWSMIYENHYPIDYSAGRILDIFYSQHLDELLKNEKHLKLYLKKSLLFDNLGIVGTCNNYLYKFIGIEKHNLNYLTRLKCTDIDILAQIEKARRIRFSDIKTYKVQYQNFDSMTFSIPNIKARLKYFKKAENEITDKLIDSLFEVISWSSYEQIPVVLKFLDKSKYGKNKQFYNFLKRDFGFFLIDNVEKKKERKNFMKLYRNNTERELYTYLLDIAGVKYKDNKGDLDFRKIHAILKYDAVESFAGGHARDYNTYAIIKLLQIHFKTRLGHSSKQCRSRKFYSCNNVDNCINWIQFLEQNKYVEANLKYPLSFHHLIYKFE